MMSDEENLGDFLSITRAVHYHVVHTWRIESYEQYFSSPKCHLTFINSSIFGHDDDPGTKWTLQLFPKGDKEASSNSNPGTETISFFINLDKSSDMPELPAKYSVEILGEDRCVHKVTGDNIFKRGSGWGRSKFMKMEELLKDKAIFLVNDAMTIRCTVHYTRHVTNQERKKKRRNSNSSASTEPSKILNTDNFDSPGSPHRLAKPFPWHDVTFVISGSCVRAHKWIVAASSPSLAQLVRGSDSIIKLEGVDAEGFAQMIRFIYTGECDLVNSSYKLMAVASKFKLESLFTKCEEYLVSILNKTSCYMIYSIGDMHCSSRLKSEALRVIENLECVSDANKLSTIPGTVAII